MFYKNDTLGGPETIYGDIKVSRATRSPCPVCGHPTGDCVPEGQPIQVHVATAPMAPPNSNMVRVPHDVIETRWLTPTTKTRVILAHKDSYISVEKARDIGLI